ncbi:CysZ protein [Microbacterium resistens]|uniref:CysZ protein n=1 Tax=Microbacterium resistens TaxID=156977 RepID=A0ABU1SAP9_9MICO|nr:EI24 domain-containing protein [Microbacterium resistens]MDR6866664.1 CysZ protein [Microbacterium resistens]
MGVRAVVGELGAGAGTLARGFGFWRTRPWLMALGLVPALIAFALLAAALLPLVLSLGPVTDALTPFAEDWIDGWRVAVRIAVGAVVMIAALVLAASLFTALTLVIGDPFYQRIWRAVEEDLGDPPSGEGSFWSTVGEGLRVLTLGVLVGVLVLLIGFIPVIGGPIAAVLGIVLPGRVLARELTGRAFDARDLDPAQRAALFRSGRSRTLGFGVATQLCFLVPLGAVLVMPAAVAGGTMLARDLRERTPTSLDPRGQGLAGQGPTGQDPTGQDPGGHA